MTDCTPSQNNGNSIADYFCDMICYRVLPLRVSTSEDGWTIEKLEIGLANFRWSADVVSLNWQRLKVMASVSFQSLSFILQCECNHARSMMLSSRHSLCCLCVRSSFILLRADVLINEDERLSAIIIWIRPMHDDKAMNEK